MARLSCQAVTWLQDTGNPVLSIKIWLDSPNWARCISLVPEGGPVCAMLSLKSECLDHNLFYQMTLKVTTLTLSKNGLETLQYHSLWEHLPGFKFRCSYTLHFWRSNLQIMPLFSVVTCFWLSHAYTCWQLNHNITQCCLSITYWTSINSEPSGHSSSVLHLVSTYTGDSRRVSLVWALSSSEWRPTGDMGLITHTSIRWKIRRKPHTSCYSRLLSSAENQE